VITRKDEVLAFMKANRGQQLEVDIVANMKWNDTSSMAYRWKQTRVALRRLEKQRLVQYVGRYMWQFVERVEDDSHVPGDELTQEAVQTMIEQLRQTRVALIKMLHDSEHDGHNMSKMPVRTLLAYTFGIPVADQPPYSLKHLEQ
jgi:hypothetical protein